MSASLRLAAVFVAALLSAPAALASHVIVPDDHPTIGAALAAFADTVYVRDGTYDEDVIITGDALGHFYGLALLPAEAPPYGVIPFPRIQRLRIEASTSSAAVTVRGFRCRGPVEVGAGMNGPATFEACAFDSGLTSGHADPLTLRGCLIRGGVQVQPWSLEMTACTVLGGVDVSWFEGTVTVRDNLIEGPAPYGLRVVDYDGGAALERNTIVGCTVGLLLDGPKYEDRIAGNQVRDCTGDGIRVEWRQAGEGSARLERNQVRRCGGDGLVLERGFYRVLDNTIDSVIGSGIHGSGTVWPQVAGNHVTATGGPGLCLEALVLAVRGNRVTRTGGDGMRLEQADTVESNVVGHCAGDGMAIATGTPNLRLVGNTAYFSSGSGFVLHAPSGAVVERNIGYANGAYGLAAEGAGTTLACDDWFGNLAGPTSGVAPGATDLEVDPAFCDAVHDDVTLASGSPLVAPPGCGRIGALDVGCTSPGGVAPEAASGALRAWPLPARRGVWMAFAPNETPMRLEVFDLAGARRWERAVAVGAGSIVWTGDDEAGHALASGVYFARLTRGGGSETIRIVIAR